MSMISFDITQLKGLHQAFMRGVKAFGDSKSIIKDLVFAVAQTAQERFEYGEAPDGTKWKTPKAGNQPLRRTLALQNSITGKVLNASEGIIGTNLVYAATHQYGDASRGITKREFLGFGKRETQAMQDVFDAHIAAAKQAMGVA